MRNIIQKILEWLQTKIKKPHPSHYLLPVLATGLIFIGIIIRFWTINKVGVFSWDEMFSFYYAQKPWRELTNILLWETNPPLHLLFLKGYFYLFPTTEFWSRLPSLIAGCASIVLIYNWTKKLFSSSTAIVAVIIFSLHPFAVYASSLNRIYSGLMLLGLLSYYCFYQIFFTATQNTRKQTTLFALIQLFLFFSHLTFIFLVFSQFITLLVLNRKKIRQYITFNLIPGLIWLIWFIPSWYLKFNAPDIGSSWFFNINETKHPLAAISSVFSNTPFTWFNIFILCLVITGVGKMIYQQIKKREIEINFWLILLPVALATTLIILGNLWQAKFFMIVLPFIIILTAYTLETVLTKKTTITIALIIGIVSFSAWMQTLPLNDWGRLNDLLRKQSLTNTKQVLINNYFLNWLYFPRYYSAPQKHLIYQPNNTDWDQLIITQNYRHHDYPIEPISEWLKKITPHYDEIIIYQDYVAGIDLPTALQNLGWTQTHLQPLDTGVMKKDLIIYAKPKTAEK